MKYLKENLNSILLISFFSILCNLFKFDYGFVNGKFYFSLIPVTVYQWPLLDNFPSLLRLKYSNYLKYDFFTNASSIINPRIFFVKTIHYISVALNINFIKTLICLNLFFTMTIPVLFYLVLIKSTSNRLNKINLELFKPIILFFILLIFNSKINDSFSIAWWLPFFKEPYPQTFGLFFGLMFFLINGSFKTNFNLLGHLFLSLSILYHPQIGILCFIFNAIIQFESAIIFFKKNKYYIVNILVNIIIEKIVFTGSNKLSSVEFINIFCYIAHSNHYVLKYFGNLTNISWKINFILIQLLIIIPTITFYIFKYKNLFKMGLFFLLAYISSVLFQYLFIDVFPSKSIASLAPIRFSIFGFWMCVITWSLLISIIFNKLKFNLKYNLPRKPFLLTLTVLIIFVSFIYLKTDDPILKIRNENQELYKFISSTNSSSIFISENSLDNINIPIICNRAVFLGNGFPFNEDYYKEYSLRSKLIYGKINKNSQIKIEIQKQNNFLKNSPKYLRKIKKIRKLDYLILNNSSKHMFKNITPIYKDKNRSIYKL